MDKFGPLKDTRNGETDTRGKDPVDGNTDECFQSLMTRNPNQRITIRDPCIIKTGKADLRTKRENTIEITAQKSSIGKHMKETSSKEESLREMSLIQFHQGYSGHADFQEYQYTHMESKSFTESKVESKEFMEVQHTYVEPNPTFMKPLGLIEPQGTRMEPLDLSLKKTKNKLQDGYSIAKLLPEDKELTVSGSSSVKVAAIPEFPPSSLPRRIHCRPLSRSQPYWIPVRIKKHLTVYGIFRPEFIVNTEEVDGNSSQEMSRRDEDDERGRIQDALKGDHIDCPPPEVTSSAYSSVSGQLTIPEMEPNSSEYICLKLDPQSRNHDEPLNEMGNALDKAIPGSALDKAIPGSAVDKTTINTRHSYIPLLDEMQENVDTWCTPSTTQSVKHKLRDKLANKQCNGGTKPFI